MSTCDNKEIQGIKYKDIEKFDKLSDNEYNIEHNNGQTTAVAMEKKQAFGLQTYLRHRYNRAATPLQLANESAPNKQKEVLKTSLSEEEAFARTFDYRNNIRFKDKNLTGALPTEKSISGYLGTTYWKIAKPEMLENPELFLGVALPGSGSNDRGMCERDGHILVYATLEDRDKYRRLMNKLASPSGLHESREKTYEEFNLRL